MMTMLLSSLQRVSLTRRGGLDAGAVLVGSAAEWGTLLRICGEIGIDMVTEYIRRVSIGVFTSFESGSVLPCNSMLIWLPDVGGHRNSGQ